MGESQLHYDILAASNKIKMAASCCHLSPGYVTTATANGAVLIISQWFYWNFKIGFLASLKGDCTFQSRSIKFLAYESHHRLRSHSVTEIFQREAIIESFSKNDGGELKHFTKLRETFCLPSYYCIYVF